MNNIRQIGIIARFLREHGNYLDYVNDVASRHDNDGRNIAEKLNHHIETYHTSRPMYAIEDILPREMVAKWERVAADLTLHYDSMQIGDLLRELARKIGMTPTELADKVQELMDNE